MALFGANNACWLRRTGWSTLEHSGGPKRLQEVQVEVFDPVWSGGWVPQILAQERPKRAKMAQKWPKSDFEHPGGPKWLEWHGTKLEQVTGASWDLGGGGGPSILAQERPKRPILAQKWPKYNFEHSRGPKPCHHVCRTPQSLIFILWYF